MELKRGDGRHCELCGSSSPKVRCEKCANQIFCLSCDDMYHRTSFNAHCAVRLSIMILLFVADRSSQAPITSEEGKCHCGK